MSTHLSNIVKYCLLDAARIGFDLQKFLDGSAKIDCLYRGRSEEILAEVAPYVGELEEGSDFNNWLFGDGWGKSWGLYINSGSSLQDLWKHFRNFLIVMDENGRELYFRFYDPRVLRVFLPSCDAGQLAEFFGPVKSFVMEGEDPKIAIEFSLKNGKLHRNILDLTVDLEIIDTESREDTEVQNDEVDFNTIV